MSSTRPWHEYAILPDHETWTTIEVLGNPYFCYITGHVNYFQKLESSRNFRLLKYTDLTGQK